MSEVVRSHVHLAECPKQTEQHGSVIVYPSQKRRLVGKGDSNLVNAARCILCFRLDLVRMVEMCLNLNGLVLESLAISGSPN